MLNTRGYKYVTLKVCEQDSPAIRRELAAYSHLDTITTTNPGALLVRDLLDFFKATGPAGEHQCLVHEPLGMSMETLRQLSPGRKIPENLLKVFLIHLLQALDFLHTDAKMIHAGIKHFAWALAFNPAILRWNRANSVCQICKRETYISGSRMTPSLRNLKRPSYVAQVLAKLMEIG